jgi:hypothetical protein
MFRMHLEKRYDGFSQVRSETNTGSSFRNYVAKSLMINTLDDASYLSNMKIFRKIELIIFDEFSSESIPLLA